MKIDELDELASELNLNNILVKPDEVIFTMDDMGDLKTTFPIPNCSKCTEKCCPPGVAISLYDVARFIDIELHKFIAGTFSGYVELFLSEDGGENVKLSRPYMNNEDPNSKVCVFMDEEGKCSIYENRPLICRAYPIAIRLDENKRKVGIWMGGCKSYDICDNEPAFRKLFLSAIQDYNEKVTSNSLLMYSRNKLREIGLGKYLEDEWNILIEYNKKNKELLRKINDLELVVERFRMPQDYGTIIQRLQSDNDWLKERMVNLEKEIKQQSERAHSIIAELAGQMSSEYRKLIETILQMKEQSQEKKGFWRR
ncbi:MAG: YkgJ family cysteine cluster protein [Candidatus Poribacteria bacterium]